MKTKDGYVYIYNPNHPRAKHGRYVAEHVLVWERVHGCPVPKGHVIHHLNGIKDDNRPENLVAISPSKHDSHTFQKILQRRIKELEAELADIHARTKKSS